MPTAMVMAQTTTTAAATESNTLEHETKEGDRMSAVVTGVTDTQSTRLREAG
jgi:hypothetical protein